jgi:hypothetical protein
VYERHPHREAIDTQLLPAAGTHYEIAIEPTLLLLITLAACGGATGDTYFCTCDNPYNCARSQTNQRAARSSIDRRAATTNTSAPAATNPRL